MASDNDTATASLFGIPRELVLLIAMELDSSDIMSLRKTNSRFNELLLETYNRKCFTTRKYAMFETSIKGLAILGAHSESKYLQRLQIGLERPEDDYSPDAQSEPHSEWYEGLGYFSLIRALTRLKNVKAVEIYNDIGDPDWVRPLHTKGYQGIFYRACRGQLRHSTLGSTIYDQVICGIIHCICRRNGWQLEELVTPKRFLYAYTDGVRIPTLSFETSELENIKANCQNLRRLHLRVEGAAEGENSRYDGWQCYLTEFLKAAGDNLEELHLAFSGSFGQGPGDLISSESFQPMCSPSLRLPKLRNLRLEYLSCEEILLKTFLRLHGHTLKQIELEESFINNGRWTDILAMLRDEFELEKLKLTFLAQAPEMEVRLPYQILVPRRASWVDGSKDIGVVYTPHSAVLNDSDPPDALHTISEIIDLYKGTGFPNWVVWPGMESVDGPISFYCDYDPDEPW